MVTDLSAKIVSTYFLTFLLHLVIHHIGLYVSIFYIFSFDTIRYDCLWKNIVSIRINIFDIIMYIAKTCIHQTVKLAIHLSFHAFRHVRALFRKLFREIVNQSLYTSHNITDFVHL